MANPLSAPQFQAAALDDQGKFVLYWQRFLVSIYSNLLTIVPAQPQGLLIFANNAAAIAGGLSPGQFYRVGGDPDLVAVVH